MADQNVVLFSGGMDSTVCLLRARHPVAVLVNYRQPGGELIAARRIAADLPVDLHECVVGWPHGPRPSGVDDAFLPGRNLMLLTVAACAIPGDVQLILGAVAEDQQGFPDCRPAFLALAGETLSAGLGKRVTVTAPLLHLTKRECVASLTEDERMIVRRSVSCYHGTGCGVCTACQKRQAAFA